ncbi:antitoxin [Streptomyces sp. NPDC006997]|uniref:antitoxin n=1 Tax=Streptomyces sp. NPDC006997 TaxID=3155356 RepID=UPI0033DFCAD3
MGIFDKFKSHGQNKDKQKKMSDTVERQVNKRTGNKYEDQVDAAQQQVEGRLGMDRDRPDQQ